VNKLNVIIADDEIDALEILSSLLLDTNKVNILKQITNPLKIESSISCLKPDAVFLDIQMPDYNGVELLENLRTYKPSLPVIFVSVHKKFALEAAKLNIFSYLLKPINRIELLETLNKLFDYYKETNELRITQNNRIKLPISNGFVFLEVDEIVSLEAEGNYTKINLIDSKFHMSSYNLGRLVTKLPMSQFQRINRGTVVNICYLKEVNRREKTCTIITNNKTEKIPVSTTFLQSIGKSG